MDLQSAVDALVEAEKSKVPISPFNSTGGKYSR